MDKKLHNQYVLLQGSFYAVSVCFIGYMVPVLQKQGFNSGQIGMFLGIRALCSVISQPYFADFIQKKRDKISFNQLIAGMILMSMLTTVVQYFNPNFVTTTILFVLYGVFTFGIISFIDAMSTLYFYDGKKINYPIARGAGSLGYAISALCVGFLMSAEAILIAQFVLFIPLLYLVIKIDTVKALDISKEQEQADSVSLKRIFKEYPLFKFFLIAIVFSFVGKEMAANFLIDVYQSLGGTSKSYGVGSFIVAASEIPAAIIFTRLSDKIGIYRLILISFFFAAIRILLILVAQNIAMVNIAQAFQMLGNGLFWAGSVQFVRTVLPAKYAVKGQASVGMCYLGLGSGVGSILSGVILEATNLTILLGAATVLSFIGFFVLLLGKKYNKVDSLN